MEIGVCVCGKEGIGLCRSKRPEQNESPNGKPAMAYLRKQEVRMDAGAAWCKNATGIKRATQSYSIMMTASLSWLVVPTIQSQADVCCFEIDFRPKIPLCFLAQPTISAVPSIVCFGNVDQWRNLGPVYVYSSCLRLETEISMKTTAPDLRVCVLGVSWLLCPCDFLVESSIGLGDVY